MTANDNDAWPKGVPFADDEQDSWDQQTGMPTRTFAANALQVWSVFQNRPVTVEEAALAFNLTPSQIRQLVTVHLWMYLEAGENGAEIICHDGE